MGDGKKRALRKRVQATESNERLYRDNVKMNNVVKLENQCYCWHRSDETIQLALGSGGPNKPTCKLCGKAIDISPITEAEFQNAFNLLDRFIDIVKLSLSVDDENSRDYKMGEALSDFQFECHRILPDTFKALNNKRNNTRRSSGGGGGDDRRPMGPGVR